MLNAAFVIVISDFNDSSQLSGKSAFLSSQVSRQIYLKSDKSDKKITPFKVKNLHVLLTKQS
jgi:hypothetical protein